MTDGWPSALFYTVNVLEGGYVFTDNADDPGGATFAGITQQFYHEAGYDRQPSWPRWVAELTHEQVGTLYWEQFWRKFRCDQLPWPANAVFFQMAINIGHPVEALQTAVGAYPDGEFGPQTLAECQRVNRAEFPDLLLAAQRAYYTFKSPTPAHANFQALYVGRLGKVRAALSQGPWVMR